ncbi:MAG TPA: hypothetical protein VER96_29960 [Polyangiaceae bacterium]|nr:hypothetical protein [Polyangiaceae bacterium]
MLHLRLNSQSIFVAALSAAGFLVACSSDSHSFSNGAAGAAGTAKGGSGNAGTSAGGSGNTGNTGNTGGTAVGGSATTPTGGSGGSASPSGGSGGTVTGSGGTAAGGSAGAGVAGGPTGGVACPTGVTFCSGFDAATLPTAAVYKVNAAPGDWSRDFELDTTVFHGGKSSLRVKSGSETGTSGSAYRMLAVPAPSGAFWVRFYIQQTELDLGGVDHNVFASAAASDEPNAASIEFAEDVGIAFNTSDNVRWPTDYGRLTSGGTKPYTLPKGMWHCIEISFDATGREQQLFINGTQQIDAKDYPAASSVSGGIKNFKFGFNQLHGPARKVWYDDVAVAPTRIKCL